LVSKESEMAQILKKLWNVEKIQSWVELIDVYEWKEIEEWKKSITLSFTYSGWDKTLTDEEVNWAHAKVLEKASKEGLETR
jgi:phenylalanyl-tRNA synthetase beta subunit